MTATVSPPLSVPTRKAQRRETRSGAWSDHTGSARDVLGQYTDSSGRTHEIVMRAGAGGSVLVVDRAPSRLATDV